MAIVGNQRWPLPFWMMVETRSPMPQSLAAGIKGFILRAVVRPMPTGFVRLRKETSRRIRHMLPSRLVTLPMLLLPITLHSMQSHLSGWIGRRLLHQSKKSRGLSSSSALFFTCYDVWWSASFKRSSGLQTKKLPIDLVILNSGFSQIWQPSY